MLKPVDCPRFHNCSAAICPLDTTPAVHLPGEPVCFYLRASGKAGAAERFNDDPVFAACTARLRAVVGRYPDVRRRVEIAAESGFHRSNLPHRSTETQQKEISGVLREG